MGRRRCRNSEWTCWIGGEGRRAEARSWRTCSWQEKRGGARMGRKGRGRERKISETERARKWATKRERRNSVPKQPNEIISGGFEAKARLIRDAQKLTSPARPTSSSLPPCSRSRRTAGSPSVTPSSLGGTSTLSGECMNPGLVCVAPSGRDHTPRLSSCSPRPKLTGAVRHWTRARPSPPC